MNISTSRKQATHKAVAAYINFLSAFRSSLRVVISTSIWGYKFSRSKKGRPK